jgi:hypothetical protein
MDVHLFVTAAQYRWPTVNAQELREENWMRPARTRVHLLPSAVFDTSAFRSGVSLHSHSGHSRERLGSLPRHLEHMPIASQFMRLEIERYRARTG